MPDTPDPDCQNPFHTAEWLTQIEQGAAYRGALLGLGIDDLGQMLERAMRAHILDPQKGWPHVRGGVMPGDGPQHIDGCDDLCADDIVVRLAEEPHDA